MADQKHMMMEIESIFDNLFGEDIESLTKANQVLLDYEKKKLNLNVSVSYIYLRKSQTAILFLLFSN